MGSMDSFKPKFIRTQDGRLIETKRHYAKFRSDHNSTKCKCLLVLYHWRYKMGNTEGLGIKALSNRAGVPYNSVKARAGKWANWGYIKRHVDKSGIRPIFTYTLDKRGKHILESILPRDWMKRYIDEIREFRRNSVKISGQSTEGDIKP